MEKLSTPKWIVMGLLLCFIFGAGLAVVSPKAEAGTTKGNLNPGVLPPQSKAFGKTLAEWGAAWQQWMVNGTTANSAVIDPTGANALTDQTGHVYFLAGTFGPPPGTPEPWGLENPVTRNATIPERIALCVPILNWGMFYPEDFPGMTEEEAAALAYELFDTILPGATLECEVDGVAVKSLLSYRAQAAPFQCYFPADSVESDVVNAQMGYPNGPDDNPPYYAPGPHLSFSDGFYVMLAPLSPGQHTIHLRCGLPDVGIPLLCDVTYHLTVEPSGKP